ncbi:hypothetical protein DICPUDRAFT_153006 [Dictyostelium purpureum]|uniref:Actin binding protein n=1 Tax=Dictyostelium purpureum TaxID=5786 RepID=F0ZMU2_DICPU|nr:uncharacterized protein DICPUDRAFT_153006 [Dictyostelium purpureum]EGC34732.1 hypothetical protein DICPUDRAFT_153006 [Dictyostelium purpureum]|eukprot:XP_003288732.1 hypothetical protein DICPUDRAFT_153006 [Dictyostelium purpureum]
MEQLLEAISDAVSSMVLYSVEADESNAAIPNILPGAQGVKSTVDYLVDLAAKSALLWDNFNQPDMKIKMVNTCDQIREATAFLLEAATILSNMPFNKPAKKTLLKGAKGIMEHMVVLLQQADLYEVTRLIRAARRTESKLKIFIGLDPGETFFATAAQDFVTSTVDVGKIVTKRINEIDDYALKKRFEEANNSLKVEVPVVLQHFAYYQRDGNDKHSFNEGHKVANTIFAIIDEIITVARLSAKSPFDLSMIQGLDLRDEDDLKDANILIAQEKQKLLSAIEAGDGKEASRALKAIKKGLNDQIVISKALAKATDNPLEKKRLEDAARHAKYVLDDLIEHFGKAVEELLAKPDNSILLNRLKANLDTIMDASDQMVTSSARLSSNDVADATKILEDLIEKIKGNISKSEFDRLKSNVPMLKPAFNEIVDIVDGIAASTEDETIKHTLEYASREARHRGSLIIGKLEDLRPQLESDPNNRDISNEMYALLTQLDQISKDLLKTVSLGTSTQVYENHKIIEENLAKLKQAALAGDKKEMQNALRLIRKAMNDQLNIARSIERVTEDQHMKEALQAAILKAEEELDDMIKNLYTAAQLVVEDTTNPKAIALLDEAIADIDALNATFLGAVSRDIMSNNTRELESNLAGLVQSIKTGDQQKTVQVLKGIIEDIKKQGLVAELASTYVSSSGDEHRAQRIKDRAVDLTNTGPDLVKAVKANLVEMNPDNLAALAQSIGAIREANKDLNNAVFLTTEEELLENSSKIDQEMRRIQTNLENGKPVTIQEVNSLMRKMNNHIRLAHQHAQSIKDPNSKKNLLDSTERLNQLVSSLVGACKKSIENPNDQDAKKQVQSLLDQAIKANLDLIGNNFSTAEELVYGAPVLLKLIGRLEDALMSGDLEEVKRCFKDLNEELSRQLFLARIAESSITDPERKKLLQEAIADLELLQNQLYPSVMEFIANPNSLESREKLQALLRKLKNEVEHVSSISSTSPSEHLESKSYAVANELNKVEKALVKNNSAEANDSVQKAINGIKQQIQLSKHIAEHTDNIAQKRAIIELSDKLEKQSLVLQQAVKESIANPNSATHKAKVAEAAQATRVLMAQLIAASSNKVPEEQVIATANSIKRDLDNLSSSLASGKDVDKAIKELKSAEIKQKVELLKAYAAKVQNPHTKKQINNAIKDLEKNINDSVQFIETKVGDKPITAEQSKQLKQLINSSSLSANQVISASTGSNEDRILSQAVKINETLDRVSASSKKGNKAEVESNLKELREEIGDTIQLVKQAAEQSKDPHKKVALNEVAEKLKTISQPITNAANNAASKPNDATAQAQLNEVINQTKELLAKAVGNSSNSEDPSNHLNQVLLKATNDINRVNGAIESGDQNSIGEATTNLKDTENRLKILAKSLPSGTPENDKIRAHVNSLANQTIPTIVNNSNTLLVQPKDTAAKQNATAQYKKALEDVGTTISLINKAPEDKIIANGTSIHRDSEQLINGAKSSDKQQVQGNVDTVYKTASEQSVLARALAAQTENQNRKQELINRANEIDKLLPQLDAANKSIQSGGDKIDKSNLDKLEKVTNDIKSSNQKIVGEAINEKLEKEHKEREAREAAFKAEQERIQREKEEREKAQQDEVMAAAQKIAERTKDLNKDSTPEGKLYSTAQGIAGIMRDLSTAASTNDKKGMIQCSKLLAEQVNIYLAQAKETAAKCTDPKLKEQIITAAQAAKNFTVQLKIIAAVKAASEDDDANTNKQQLVKCSKGLAKAVVQTINAVEIGQIRVR